MVQHAPPIIMVGHIASLGSSQEQHATHVPRLLLYGLGHTSSRLPLVKVPEHLRAPPLLSILLRDTAEPCSS